MSTKIPVDRLPLAPERQFARARRMLGLMLFVCVLPVLLSYGVYFVVRPQSRINYASLIEPQRPLPDALLLPAQDLAGRHVSLTALKGQWLLIVVAPAECGPVCEQALFLQRQLREMTGAARDRIDKVWLVDSAAPIAPALLDAMRSEPSVTVWRVERAALGRWLQAAPGQALEDHLYIVDPLGHWMMRAPAQPEPARLKKDLERLLRASAAWDLPGRVP